jgi:uncharacterized membrane protein
MYQVSGLFIVVVLVIVVVFCYLFWRAVLVTRHATDSYKNSKKSK